MLSAEVIEKYHRNYPIIFNTMTRRFLGGAGHMVEGMAKRLTPVKTGQLRRSINSQVVGDEARVGTNVHYAPYVEYGTRRPTKEQPYLRPALDNNRNKIIRLYGEEIRRSFSGR